MSATPKVEGPAAKKVLQHRRYVPMLVLLLAK